MLQKPSIFNLQSIEKVHDNSKEPNPFTRKSISTINSYSL